MAERYEEAQMCIRDRYEKEKDTRFLVFDLGGGTFDVSILELYHNMWGL